MNSKQITEMVLDEDLKNRFGLSATGSMGEGEVESASEEETQDADFDPNNHGRRAFNPKKNGVAQPVTGMPLASPNPIDIPESPVNVKIDLSDAVNFIRQWEGVKSGEMRPAFAESHLKNIAMENYLAELKARTQAAQQLGQSQILLPAIPQAIYTGEAKTAGKSEDDDYGKKIMATLAPFFATQKLFGMGDSDSQAEKPTEVAKTIMDMGRSMAEMNSNNQGEQPKITEVIDSVISAAEKLSGGSGGGKTKTEDLADIIKLAETFSNMKEDSTKIQVPQPDGTFTEMSASQYLLSQLLTTKNEGGKPSEGVKPDMITITDPEGNVKHMPVAVYMAEQMLSKGKDEGGSTPEQPTSKLLSALVGTVERLSTNMNDMQRRLSEQSNPLGMMQRLKQESDEWNQFREGFMGSADSTQSEREAAEEKKREHELELERIKARKESSMALASVMQMQPSAPTPDAVPELNTAEDFQRDMDERLIASQQRAKNFSGFHAAQVTEIEKDKGIEKTKGKKR